jgi:hypothetical protein
MPPGTEVKSSTDCKPFFSGDSSAISLRFIGWHLDYWSHPESSQPDCTSASLRNCRLQHQTGLTGTYLSIKRRRNWHKTHFTKYFSKVKEHSGFSYQVTKLFSVMFVSFFYRRMNVIRSATCLACIYSMKRLSTAMLIPFKFLPCMACTNYSSISMLQY